MLESLEERLTPATPSPAGDVVGTFGTAGTTLTGFFDHINSAANAAVLQADGRVVAVGTTGRDNSTDFIVARYNADGSPDTSFGPNHNGRVLTAFTESAIATAVALQRDGKILVAGYTEDHARIAVDFALARYSTDGSLDKTFGTGGIVTTSFGPTSMGALGPHTHNAANSIVIDSAGRIVLGGYTEDDSGNFLFALARYTVNGSLDRTFGTGGLVATNFGVGASSAIDAMALDAKGRIVVAGYTGAGKDDMGNLAIGFALARYTTNGSLDKTFGTGGEVTTKVTSGNDDRANSLAIQPDGKILVAGSTYDPNKSLTDFALARYTTGGSLDKAFGIGGTVVTDFGDTGFSGINAMTLDAQGRIAVAGFTSPGYNHNPVAYDSPPILALARYTSSGSLDRTFGTGGEVAAGFPSGLVSAEGIARGPNSQLLVVGVGTSGLLRFNGDFALARYNANGSLDRSFGSGGKVLTPITVPVRSSVDVITAQPDGKLIVVGNPQYNGPPLGILRLNKDGSLDTTFGSGGEVLPQVGLNGSTDSVSGVVVEPDGKILLVISSAPSGNQGRGYVSLLRFNADGSVDARFGKGGQTPLIELPGQQNAAVSGNPFGGVVVQPDGKIVLGAGAGGLDLIRLNKDGSLDTSFGSGLSGSVMTAFSGFGTKALVLQPDGKIVLTGTVNGDLALARFNADGSTDRTFGSAGVVHTSLTPLGIAGVVLQPGGKIVVGGNGGKQNDFFVMRFNTNGSLDKTFGSAGQAFTAFGGGGTATSIVIDPAGRIVLAGYDAVTPINPHIYVARYNSNGQLDTHFGARGRLIMYFYDLNSLLPYGARTTLMLDPQGRLMVAGPCLLPTNTLAIRLTEYAT
jgi:uncharacterized delta-60 repeat protein